MTPQNQNPDQTRILRERARLLALEKDKVEDHQKPLQVIEFSLAQERYAVEAAWVREVFPLLEFTALPCVPSFLLGLVNVRGEILPLLDLKKLFQLPPCGITDFNKVLILSIGEQTLCLLTDAVLGMRDLLSQDFIESNDMGQGARGPYTLGLTRDLTIVLNGKQLLADPKLVVRETVK